MQQQFSHVILTRFNLRSGSSRETRLRNSHGWLANRFELFEKYCLPSVIGQTNQNFKWFIFFDIDTPQHYKERALEYSKKYKNIKMYWVRGLSLNEVQDFIRENCPDNKQILITTRLDNDDAINVNFVDRVQEKANKIGKIVEPLVINFDNGLCLNENRAYQHNDSLNAFTSLIEPWVNDFNTVWKYQHRQLDHFNVAQLTQPSMWLQGIHSSNVSNRVRGVRINNNELLDNFNINFDKENLKVDNSTLILLENTLFYPIRSMKEFCRSMCKKIVQYTVKR